MRSQALPVHRFTVSRSEGNFLLHDSASGDTQSFPDASTAAKIALDGLPTGGSIHFGDGDFELDHPIQIYTSHIAISGNGSATRLVIGDVGCAVQVDAANGQLGYIEISNLTIQGTYFSPTSESIGIQSAHRVSFLNIRDVTILSCKLGMKFDSLWKPRIANVTIRTCWIGIEARGDRPDPDKPGRTLGCELRVINSNLEDIRNIGIYAHDNASGLILTHVEIGSIGNIGLFLQNFDWAHLTAVLVDSFPDSVDSNQLNPNGIGYRFENVRGVQLGNCWVGSTGGYGMQIENSKQIIINGMQFRPGYRIGIYCRGGEGITEKCEEVTIASCQFSSASDVAIWLDNEVSHSRVFGNNVSHCVNGIKETGNCDYNEIANNEIWGPDMVTPLELSGDNSHEWHNRVP